MVFQTTARGLVVIYPELHRAGGYWWETVNRGGLMVSGGGTP